MATYNFGSVYSSIIEIKLKERHKQYSETSEAVNSLGPYKQAKNCMIRSMEFSREESFHDTK